MFNPKLRTSLIKAPYLTKATTIFQWTLIKANRIFNQMVDIRRNSSLIKNKILIPKMNFKFWKNKRKIFQIKLNWDLSKIPKMIKMTLKKVKL